MKTLFGIACRTDYLPVRLLYSIAHNRPFVLYFFSLQPLTLYRHFTGKGDILLVLADQALAVIRQAQIIPAATRSTHNPQMRRLAASCSSTAQAFDEDHIALLERAINALGEHFGVDPVFY